jgi:hypothetical protein
MTLKCSDPSCTWRVRYSLRREQDIRAWHINGHGHNQSARYWCCAVHDMTCMPLVEAARLRATSMAKFPQILTAPRKEILTAPRKERAHTGAAPVDRRHPSGMSWERSLVQRLPLTNPKEGPHIRGRRRGWKRILGEGSPDLHDPPPPSKRDVRASCILSLSSASILAVSPLPQPLS